ncbi:ADP-ribosyl cyclase/cyclic ADP-ribose hydrolase 1-like isoform X1 [Acipenser oxyrinchus oxyrinchus]|uniref:ADP-ribosyl cyclase/cyclic ADP-ribose hydrolase n=1 Tax=Acipenser oxyrinchus oxyrinchus TaxID=40147 RepID=A0AAD8LV53_ACIOX|nr:ADP-ribosyl cyclase/cyclic ADP-ribose hydrolase 1-like isoform X1 [Acipenser oxyrinchus oxyrinchus]
MTCREFCVRRRRLLSICGSILILVAIVLVVVMYVKYGVDDDTKGTTKNLKTIVIERCMEYIRAVSQMPSSNNCDAIWEGFQNSFLGKDPCKVHVEDYDQFITTVQQDIPCNKSLFWSKTGQIAHDFTKATKCFMTLEDTLLGHMMDGLKWCGQQHSKEFNYTSCPGWNECEFNPVRSFWRRASAHFAELACGNVMVMLNGSIDSPFNKQSIFGSVEIKKFDPEKISYVSIRVIDSLQDRTSCNSISLQDLGRILNNSRLDFDCKDIDKSEILQCINDPISQSCDCVNWN